MLIAFNDSLVVVVEDVIGIELTQVDDLYEVVLHMSTTKEFVVFSGKEEEAKAAYHTCVLNLHAKLEGPDGEYDEAEEAGTVVGLAYQGKTYPVNPFRAVPQQPQQSTWTSTGAPYLTNTIANYANSVKIEDVDLSQYITSLDLFSTTPPWVEYTQDEIDEAKP